MSPLNSRLRLTFEFDSNRLPRGIWSSAKPFPAGNGLRMARPYLEERKASHSHAIVTLIAAECVGKFRENR
jgi:hypothetical protein